MDDSWVQFLNILGVAVSTSPTFDLPPEWIDRLQREADGELTSPPQLFSLAKSIGRVQCTKTSSLKLIQNICARHGYAVDIRSRQVCCGRTQNGKRIRRRVIRHVQLRKDLPTSK